LRYKKTDNKSKLKLLNSQFSKTWCFCLFIKICSNWL